MIIILIIHHHTSGEDSPRLRRGLRALAASRAPPAGTPRTGRVPRPWAEWKTPVLRPRFFHGAAHFLSCSARPAAGKSRTVCFTPEKAVLREGFFCGDATPQKNASTRGAAKSRHTAHCVFHPGKSSAAPFPAALPGRGHNAPCVLLYRICGKRTRLQQVISQDFTHWKQSYRW